MLTPPGIYSQKAKPNADVAPVRVPKVLTRPGASQPTGMSLQAKEWMPPSAKGVCRRTTPRSSQETHVSGAREEGVRNHSTFVYIYVYVYVYAFGHVIASGSHG